MYTNSTNYNIPENDNSILKGALQGLAGFGASLANNNKMLEQRSYDEGQQNVQANKAAILAGLQQKMLPKNPPTWMPNFNQPPVDPQDYYADVHGRQLAMDTGYAPITPEYRRLKAEEAADKALFSYPRYLEMYTSKDPKKQQKAQQWREAAINNQLGIAPVIPEKTPFNWKSAITPEKSISFTDYLKKPNSSPQGVDQADWDAATPEQQQQLLDYMNQGK